MEIGLQYPRISKIAKTTIAQEEIWVGEYTLAHDEDPKRADTYFADALALLPTSSQYAGLATFDSAISLWEQGAYEEAATGFRGILNQSRIWTSLDIAKVSVWERHAAACAGYHADHARLGIPEPTELDPNCAAASLASSLRSLGLPYDKRSVLQKIHVTGRGSSSADVTAAGKKLGVDIFTVSADDSGLINLPKPLIAHVERDHFISVVSANKLGIKYICSDCGSWPGGQITLTWTQWHALHADFFQAIVKPRSAWDQALKQVCENSPPSTTNTVATIGSFSNLPISELTAQAFLLESLIKGHVIALEGSGGYCGSDFSTAKCTPWVNCPMDVHCHNGGTNDPVNLATGEEEYSANDMNVYNPHGPSVHWGRVYDSLRPQSNGPDSLYQQSDFGYGWSNNYNYFVEDATSTVTNPFPNAIQIGGVGCPSPYYTQVYPGLTDGNSAGFYPDSYGSPQGSDTFDVYNSAGTLVASSTNPTGTNGFTFTGNWGIRLGQFMWLDIPTGGANGNSYEVICSYGGLHIYVAASTQGAYNLVAGALNQNIAPNGPVLNPSSGNSWEIDLNGTPIATSSQPAGWITFEPTNPQSYIGTGYVMVSPLSAALGGTYVYKQGSAPSISFTLSANQYVASAGIKYFVMPNGSRVPITPSGVPSSTNPIISCSVPNGTPMSIQWDYDSSSSLGHYTVTMADRSKLITGTACPTIPIFNGVNEAATYMPLKQIKDVVGNAINFNYGTVLNPVGFPLLSSITDATNGTALITFGRDPGNGVSLHKLTAYDGRLVYYWQQSTNTTPSYPNLGVVSQILPPGTADPYPGYIALNLWRNGYVYTANSVRPNTPLLGIIKVPSPTGSGGFSAATINYGDPNDLYVTSTVDANGNTSTYSFNDSNQTTVTITNPSGSTVDQFQASFDPNMSETIMQDGDYGPLAEYDYSDPNDAFKPSSVADGNGAAAISPGCTGVVYGINNQIPNYNSSWLIYQGSNIVVQGGTPNAAEWNVTTNSIPGSLEVQFNITASSTHLLPPSETTGLNVVASLGGGGTQVTSNTFNIAQTTGTSTVGTTNFTYDIFGNVLTSTSPRGVTTTTSYIYDNSLTPNYPIGIPSKVQVGSKTPTSLSYDSTHSYLLSTVSGALPGDIGVSQASSHLLNQYTYDTLGNITQISTVGPNSTPVLYGTSPNSTYSKTTLTYATGTSEGLGEPLAVSESGQASNGTTTTATSNYTYDAHGNVASATDPSSNTTLFSYAVPSQSYILADQLQSVTYPATGQSGTGSSSLALAYQYPDGLPAAIVLNNESGALQRKTTFTYGNEGENLSSTVRLTPTGSDTTVENTAYDAEYRIASVTQHQVAANSGQTTTYSYFPVGVPSAGRLQKLTYPGGDSVSFTAYDFDSNVLSRTDGNAVVTNYTYNDPESLLTAVAYPSATSLNESFAYDNYGRLSTSSDGAAPSYVVGTTTYPGYAENYDDLDDLLSETTTYAGVTSGSELPTQTLSYVYKPDGALSSMKTPDSSTVAYVYSYDGLDRLTKLTNPLNEPFTWTYQTNGWPTAQTLANTSSTTMLSEILAYNSRGFLTNDKISNSSGTSLAQFGGTTNSTAMVYDAAGDRTSMPVNFPAAKSTSFTNSYAYDGRGELLTETIPLSTSVANTFNFDLAGNLTKIRGSAATYNSDNQLTLDTYDGNGSPKTEGTAGFGFDPESRNTTITVSGANKITEAYRYDGLRAWKQGSGGTSARVYFLYDQSETPVAELNSTGTVQAENTFGALGLVERSGTSGVAGQGFYAFDPADNNIVRTSTTGAVTTSCLFDSFGKNLFTSGTTPTTFGWAGGSGGYSDPESGYVVLGHRTYDQAEARFLNRDPIGYNGGLNVYEYGSDDPIDNGDPNGFAMVKHHSFPRFIGGAANQPLTVMDDTTHRQLHSDLYKYLRKTNPGMVPSRYNTGFRIKAKFTDQERISTMRGFYDTNGSKYPDASRDFAAQCPVESVAKRSVFVGLLEATSEFFDTALTTAAIFFEGSPAYAPTVLLPRRRTLEQKLDD